MNDYKSMQKRMKETGATMEEITEAVLEQKCRYIAALESTVDTLHLRVKLLEAEIAEYKELVGVHKEQRDGPQYPNPEEIKAAGDEATPAAAKSPT